MAKRIESKCVDCGLPCTSICQYKGAYDEYLVCDKCQEDVSRLFLVNGKELCLECASEVCKDDIIKEYKGDFLELAELYLEDCEVIG